MSLAKTLTCTSLVLAANSFALNQPNFVFILADDMGWNGTSVQVDSGVKSSQSDFYRTPYLEELAAAGMTFSNAYAPAAMCTPSRAAFLTGKTPAQLHMTTPGPPQRAQNWMKVCPPWHTNQLPEKELTIAEILKENGYTTAHYGKWHLGAGGPAYHGFDFSDGDTENEGPAYYDAPNPKDIFGITSRAETFMAKSVKAGKPFYVQLSHYAVHTPVKYNKESMSVAATWKKGSYHSDVDKAAMTRDLDTSIGMVVSYIKKLGIEDNTYIIFTSDNGPGLRENRSENYPLNGSKGNLYEGGIRVPMIISGPKVEKGKSCSSNVVGYDLFPTICTIAGIKIPKNVEGASLVTLLSGKDGKRKSPVYFYNPHYNRGPDQVPQAAIIYGDYKLLVDYHNSRMYLFNLEKDVSEKKPLSGKYRNQAEKLKEQLFTYLKQINAQVMSNNSNYDPGAKRVQRR